MARLLTFSPSHFSEKARWALDRFGVPFTEDCIAPGLHFAAFKLAGGRSAPTLVLDDGRVLTDSSEILEHLSKAGDEKLSLYPPALREEVVRLEDELDEQFAFEVRDYVYSWVLEDKQLTAAAFAKTKPSQQLYQRMFFPIIRVSMKQRMKLSRMSVDEHFAVLLAHWRKFDARLEGKRFLVGDQFTAADLTVAALGAPVIGETAFGGAVIPLELRPAAERDRAEQLRASPTGQHIQRMYREHRRDVPS